MRDDRHGLRRRAFLGLLGRVKHRRCVARSAERRRDSRGTGRLACDGHSPPARRERIEEIEEIGEAREAIALALRERSLDRVVDDARKIGAPRAERSRRLGEEAGDHPESAVGARPGQRPGEELVGSDAPRELIRPSVELAARDLLGRHVGGSPDEAALAGDRRAVARARPVGRDGHRVSSRDPEVEDFDDAVLAHHHVLGLHVAVDDAGCVRGVEGARGGEEPRELARPGWLRRADVRAERLAGDVFHRDERQLVHLAEIVDGDLVRVLERGGGARLAKHPRDRFAAGGAVDLAVEEEHLERDPALEPRVEGAVDLAHSALAELGLDTEPVEGAPDLQHCRAKTTTTGRWAVAQQTAASDFSATGSIAARNRRRVPRQQQPERRIATAATRRSDRIVGAYRPARGITLP